MNVLIHSFCSVESSIWVWNPSLAWTAWSIEMFCIFENSISICKFVVFLDMLQISISVGHSNGVSLWFSRPWYFARNLFCILMKYVDCGSSQKKERNINSGRYFCFGDLTSDIFFSGPVMEFQQIFLFIWEIFSWIREIFFGYSGNIFLKSTFPQARSWKSWTPALDLFTALEATSP